MKELPFFLGAAIGGLAIYFLAVPGMIATATTTTTKAAVGGTMDSFMGL